MSTNVFRSIYRPLNPAEQSHIDSIKAQAETLYDLIDELPPSREVSIAKTKLEEAVMWGVKAASS